MDRYREVLARLLKGTEGRSVYSADEVKDLLLDLWLASNVDDVIEPEVALTS